MTGKSGFPSRQDGKMQDRGFGSIFLQVLVVSENKMLFIPFPMAYILLYVFREITPVFKQVSSLAKQPIWDVACFDWLCYSVWIK